MNPKTNHRGTEAQRKAKPFKLFLLLGTCRMETIKKILLILLFSVSPCLCGEKGFTQ